MIARAPGPAADVSARVTRLLADAGLGGRVEVLARLGSGQHHLTLKLRTDDGLLVARLPGEAGHPPERLSAELAMQQAAEAAGLTPARLWFDTRTGASLSRWMEGEPLTPEALWHAETAAEAGALVRRLQALPVTVSGPDPGLAARDYAARLDADSGSRARLNRLEVLAAACRPDPAARRPAHGDLVAGNLLRTPGGLRLLDWEYAGLAHPWWDLASLVGLHALPLPAARAMLRAAGEAPGLMASTAFTRLVELVVLLAWAWAAAECRSRPSDPRPRRWLTRLEALLAARDAGPAD